MPAAFDELAKEFDVLAAQVAIDISSQQREQLIAYVLLIEKWNKAYNLTSVRDPKEMLVKHIFDSVVVSPLLQGTNFVDVGTGPGLPGIPLAILNPEKSFTLVDSLGKRIRFIKQSVYELKIDNVTALQTRVEDLQMQTKFDAVLSRAFASLKDMLHWCQHLVNSEGQFLALKGQISQDELAQIPDGFLHVSTHKLVVPQLEADRHLIKITKSA